MNKTYILLRDLPYIKAGTEYVSADGFNGVFDKCSYVPNKMGMMHERFAIHIDWIKDNPEWFKEKQEDKPKEWEILKCWDGRFIGGVHNFIGDNNKDKSTPCLKLDHPCDIYSVKRLSDGLIFQVQEETNYGIIEKFYIDNLGTMIAHFVGGNGAGFHSLKKIKQPPVDTDAFVWDEKLVEEMIWDKWGHADVRKVISDFKQSKSTPKEDKIEFRAILYKKEDCNGHWHDLLLSHSLPPEKYEAVKKAIEFVINDNGFPDITERKQGICIKFTYKGVPYRWEQSLKAWADYIDSMIHYKKLYSEDELLEAQSKAFYAGRERTNLFEKDYCAKKYPTFSDYIQSIKENK